MGQCHESSPHILTVDGDCEDEDSFEIDRWELGKCHLYTYRELGEGQGT